MKGKGLKMARNWRAKHRAEIESASREARAEILKANQLSKRGRREEYGEDGRLARVPVSLEGQLNYNRAALLHLQEAENRVAWMRTLLTKQRERLETEFEREQAFGPESAPVLESRSRAGVTSPKLTRDQRREAALAAVAELNPNRLATSWGRRTAFNEIGHSVGVTGDTVRKWAGEAEVVA